MAKKSKGGQAQSNRVTAETLAGKQREISVSEFFAKNRHLLGFDNPRKALLTTVKEAVDNALDACEEAGILPDIIVHIEELTAPPKRGETDAKKARGRGAATQSGRYRVTITDNGPGIVRKQVDNIFGKLLYGSKFHRMKMSRGQQGIGISAAGMYGLMTTGRPMVITTRPRKSKPAHHIELAMDTSKNRPEVTVDVETDDFPKTSSGTGTRVAIELEARYMRGKTSVDEYLEQTAIANPHAEITFIPPKGANAEGAEKSAEDAEAGGGVLVPGAAGTSGSKAADGAAHAALPGTVVLEDRIIYPRTIDELPPETQEIKPHPYGVELGSFLQMLKATEQTQLAGFLSASFCRVPPAAIKEVTKAASTKQQTISGGTWLKNIDHAAAERIYKALQEAKLRAPPTDCLAPIGVRQMLAGLLKGVKAEFYAAATREPAVYRGNPFQIEAAIAFGGDLPGDEAARVIRFANRVPLLYQQSACCSVKSVIETGWRNYGLSQPKGSLPVGPMVIMIHMASVWVPFTSESKEAIADYDEIRKEMKLALQECGRKLGTYMRRRQKMRRESERRDVFERYIGEISKSCALLTGCDAKELYDALERQAKRRTAIADAQLDDEGKIIPASQGPSRLDGDDGVIIVDGRGPGPEDEPGGADGAAEAPAEQKKPLKKQRRSAGGKPKRQGGKDDPSLFEGAGREPGRGKRRRKSGEPVGA
ncbi:MAG: DNA topoisomerase VI subunit B [Phycisphaerales bacterium JB039]